AAGIARDQWNKDYSVLMDGPSKPQLLTQAAEDFEADLVLLGTNQGAAKGRFVAGSTADSLLHYSPIPVGLTPRAVKLSKHGVGCAQQLGMGSPHRSHTYPAQRWRKYRSQSSKQLQ